MRKLTKPVSCCVFCMWTQAGKWFSIFSLLYFQVVLVLLATLSTLLNLDCWLSFKPARLENLENLFQKWKAPAHGLHAVASSLQSPIDACHYGFVHTSCYGKTILLIWPDLTFSGRRPTTQAIWYAITESLWSTAVMNTKEAKKPVLPYSHFSDFTCSPPPWSSIDIFRSENTASDFYSIFIFFNSENTQLSRAFTLSTTPFEERYQHVSIPQNTVSSTPM